MIPFNRPSMLGNELAYIQLAVQSGVISGEGSFGRRCEVLLEDILGKKSTVLLTPSCTDALEMCALLLNLDENSEVIMPSYTFVSTALAFALRGARPVFVDTREEYPNISAECVEAAITSRTKAIIVVHYGGAPCEMAAIRQVAERHGIAVIEDAAHGLGGTFEGQPLGTLGDLATFSFHETKNVTCGEGGALVINDPALVERSYVLRDKGTNRRKLKRGEVDFYTWVDLGSSFVMSDVLAAFLYSQLERLEEINERRMRLIRRYLKALDGLDESNVKLPDNTAIMGSTGHVFFLELRDDGLRRKLQQYLQQHYVYTVSHYEPLHLSPFATANYGPQTPLPNTERFARGLLRLPMFYELESIQQTLVCNLIKRFFEREV